MSFHCLVLCIQSLSKRLVIALIVSLIHAFNNLTFSFSCFLFPCNTNQALAIFKKAYIFLMRFAVSGTRCQFNWHWPLCTTSLKCLFGWLKVALRYIAVSEGRYRIACIWRCLAERVFIQTQICPQFEPSDPRLKWNQSTISLSVDRRRRSSKSPARSGNCNLPSGRRFLIVVCDLIEMQPSGNLIAADECWYLVQMDAL